jgi:hypothetical protein
MRLRDISIVCAALGIAATAPVAAPQVSVQTNVQTNNQTGLPPAGAKKIPANSIAAVADKLNWDVAKLGPLLIVAPEKMTTRSNNPMGALMGGFSIEDMQPGTKLPDNLKPPALPQPGPGGYRVEVLAAAIKRKVVKAGQLSTIAPIDVVKPTNMMDFMQGSMMEEMMDAGEKEPILLSLLASLNGSQWQMVTSETGLGPEGLDAAQKKQFYRLFPTMTEVNFKKGTGPGPRKETDFTSLMSKVANGDAPDPAAIREMMGPALPQEQIDRLRLRIKRDLTVNAVSSKANTAGVDTADADMGGMNIDPGLPETEWDAESVWVKSPPMNFIEQSIGMVTKSANNRIPAIPKKTDVDYQAGALQVPISLTGLKNLGELVERVAKAARVQLVCDKRFASLSVLTRGDSAKAGDVLQAITRAIHGTVRKLGDGDERIYIVTDDLVPASYRMTGQMGDMMRLMAPMAGKQKAAATEGRVARAKLSAKNPLPTIRRGWGGNLPEALWQAAESGKDDFKLPLTSLPEPYQKQAREQWAEMPKEVQGTKFAPDAAQGQMNVVGEMFVPATGAFFEVASISASDLRPDANKDIPVEPLKWPERDTVRSIYIGLPQDAASTTLLIETATKRGLTHIFTDAPVYGDISKLRTFADALVKAGLKLVPVVSPLHGEAAVPNAPRDIALTGETSRAWANSKFARELNETVPGMSFIIDNVRRADYIVPEAVDPSAVATRLELLASLPGVAWVALHDLSAPGYGAESNLYGEGGIWSGGGSLGARTRFVKAQQMDPADIVQDMGFDAMMGESLIDRRSYNVYNLSRAWTKDLKGRRDNVLNRIDLILKRTQLPVPVIQSQPVTYQGTIWQGWTGEVWNYSYEMPEDFDPTKSDVNSMPAWKKPKNRKKPAIKDTLSFIQPADFFQRQGMGADVNDPHLLRPDEERLAAWISDQLASDVMAAYDEDPTDEEPKAELIERNGFVLNLMGVSTADAIGFLQRRVAEQGQPKPAGPKPATTAKPAEVKPTSQKPDSDAISAGKPQLETTKSANKPAAKPANPPKPVTKPKVRKK